MTPKEKAIELVDKFTIPYYEWDGDGYNINWDETFKNRKQCALIAVNEIIESSPLDPNDAEEWLQPEDWFSDANISAEKYWLEVKQEIEKL